jgi:hypothetical protein
MVLDDIAATLAEKQDNEPSGRLCSNQLEHIRAHFQRISCKG